MIFALLQLVQDTILRQRGKLMKYFLTVDQIQEQKVVLLSDQPELALNFPLELLPAELKEGDVLAINIENDSLERQKREQEVAQLLQELTTGNN